MKKVFTLLFAGFMLLTAQGQLSDMINLHELNPISYNSLPVRQYTPSSVLRGGPTQIAIDYDSFDREWADNHAGNKYKIYPWHVNAHNDTAYYYFLSTAAQVYDTLMDVYNNFYGYPLATTTIRVDSFDIIMADSNASGEDDTFIVSVFDKSNAVGTGGFNGGIAATPIWADTLIAPGGYIPYAYQGPPFGIFRFRPEVTLPLGHTFGIKVDFYGDTSDQLYLIASYREQCGDSSNYYADTNLVAPNNSSFYLNLGAASGFYDYDTSYAFLAGNCPYFVIQNWFFFPYLTLNPPCPAITVTASQLDSTTTATVSASGGTAPYSYSWNTNPAENTDTVTGLNVDSTYTVTATDYIGCTSTATVTIACPAISVTVIQIGTTDTALASVKGGTAPYTYSWNTSPLQTGDTVTGLIADSTYSVTVTDHNACTGTATVTGIAGMRSLTGITNIHIYPNPSNGIFTLAVQLEVPSEVATSISDITGRLIFESNDQAVKNFSKPVNLSNLSAGIYFVAVKTKLGCVNQRIVTK